MKGFLSRISKNPEGRFKRYVRYRKTGRIRQAAGAGKHPPGAAARGNKPLRFLPDVIHSTCRGGGRTYSAGADRRVGHPAQKQRKPEKRRGGQTEPTRTGEEKPMKKRILSILLVCCMVLTMHPTAVFAAVSDSLGNTPEENQAILDQLSALTGGSSCLLYTSRCV